LVKLSKEKAMIIAKNMMRSVAFARKRHILDQHPNIRHLMRGGIFRKPITRKEAYAAAREADGIFSVQTLCGQQHDIAKQIMFACKNSAGDHIDIESSDMNIVIQFLD